MTRTFGAQQMYEVEDIVNAAADVLIHLGFEAGEQADAEHYDGGTLADMSGLVDRLLDVRMQVEQALGLANAYEMYREAREVTA
jgi:hypothetical protein